MRNPQRSLASRLSLSGIAHYCLSTLILGALVRLRTSRQTRRQREDQPPDSVIIFRLDRIGDVVLSSAMLRELRKLFPHAHITLVVNTLTRPLLEFCPYVDTVLALPAQSGSLKSMFRELRTILNFCKRNLARRTWDLAVVPRWDTDTYFATFMCFYTGALRRIGFSEQTSPAKRRLNWGFDRFYTDILPPGPLLHEAERNLEIVRYLGGNVLDKALELWLTRDDKAYAVQRLNDFGLTALPNMIGFGVGSSQGRTRWPAVRFAELIEYLRRRHDFTPVILCGPGEISIATEIETCTNTRLLVLDGLSLRQTAAFLAHCTLFIGNDSGPMHIAAAAGIPVVEISCHPVHGAPEGENSPARFGPFTSCGAIVRPLRPKYPCERGCTSNQPHCIAEVSVAQVGAAANGLLAASRKAASLTGFSSHHPPIECQLLQ